MTAQEINYFFNLPTATLFRYLNKALKKEIILYLCDRNLHPKKFPIKLYFINNLKQNKK